RETDVGNQASKTTEGTAGYVECRCCGVPMVGAPGDTCDACHTDGSACDGERCDHSACDSSRAWHCFTGHCDGSGCEYPGECEGKSRYVRPDEITPGMLIYLAGTSTTPSRVVAVGEPTHALAGAHGGIRLTVETYTMDGGRWLPPRDV